MNKRDISSFDVGITKNNSIIKLIIEDSPDDDIIVMNVRIIKNNKIYKNNLTLNDDNMDGGQVSFKTQFESKTNDTITNNISNPTKKRVKNLSRLTEKKKDVLKENMNIEAKFLNGNGWYSGIIKKINDDNSYDIEYDDGDYEKNVLITNIRKVIGDYIYYFH